ncbi:MAG: serine/threonine-protein kinase [Polyangiales bacterium]
MSASAEKRIGEIIDRYRIEGLLGEGGFGAVYRAKHVVMARDVALKLLHPGSDRDDDLRERFLREAQAAAAVGHPSIVQIFDCGVTQEGHAFIAMEMLRGEDLEEHLKKHGSLSREHAVGLVVKLLDALDAAHRAGIVHRDLKPANIFLLEDSDNIKVLDFGISQMRGEGIRTLTRTGMVMGTPHYMAPETFRGVANVDLRADLYAVGAMLYELFSGTTPHDAKSYEQLVVRVATLPAPSVHGAVPDLHPELARVVDRALTSNPDDRWPDARSFRDALLPFLSPTLSATQQDAPPMSAPVSMTPAWGIGASPMAGQPSLQTTPMAAADPLGATGVADASHTPAGYVATPSAHPPPRTDAPSSSKRGLVLLAAGVVVLLAVFAVAFLADSTGNPDTTAQMPATTAPTTTAPTLPVPPTTPPTATPAEADVLPDLLPDKPELVEEALATAEPAAQQNIGSGQPPPLAPPTTPPPSVDVVRVDLVTALSTPRGPAVAFGDSAGQHLMRCARSQPHIVRVMLMVGSGGRISIAQPDPNEDHGDDAVASCVANRMAGQGPIPNGTNGILVYRVELPPH